MFDFIKTQFKTGDAITLHCANGSYSGIIAFMDADTIVLTLAGGGMCGIKGSDINFFETPVVSSVAQMPVTSAPEPDTEVAPVEVSAQLELDEIKTVQTAESEPMHKEEKTSEVKDAKQANKYKVGDIIPLDKLRAIDPTVDSKKRIKKRKKMISLDGGLDGLAALVQDKHDADNQQFVPPRGEIKWVDINRNFGFIKDNRTNQDVYFNFNQIIDEELKSRIAPYTHVDYSTVQYPQGLQANCVHRPKKVIDLLAMAKELSQKGENKSALEITRHILAEYPDNFDAGKLESQLKKLVPSYQQKVTEYSNAYTKAKKYHTEKDFNKAIEFYLKAIEKREKLDSAIKDLGMLYGSLYKGEQDPIKKEEYRQTAIDFMRDNEKHLAGNTSSYNFLESFYYTIRDFENFIFVVNKLLDEEEVIKDKRRTSLLLCKKAAAFIQMSEPDKAWDIIDECLELDPTNLAASKLKAILQEETATEDIDSIFSASSFDKLTSGLSPFIEQTLRDYQEYFGVPAKVIESGDFNAVTLREIRKLIDTAGKARARERAKYLLTEGKLMLDIEPNDTARLRSVMARYCNAMALNHISNNSSPDITRFYYNEAFSLEESYESTANQISLYLLSHCYKYNELLNSTTKTPSVDDALKKVTAGSFDSKVWESILSMMLYNQEISAQITSKLYSSHTLKNDAFQALRHFGQDVSKIKSKEDFVSVWNTARDSRLRDYKKTITEIKSASETSSVEELAVQLYTLRNAQTDWMCALDIRRINNIISNIAPAIDNYVKSSGYRNKQTNYNNAQGQLQQLIDDITTNEGPTKISFEAILPLLEKTQTLIKESFDVVIKMSEPKISIKLLSSDTVVDSDNIVSIQVSIENDKDSSPISEVSVEITSSPDVIYVKEDNTSYNAIEGGESRIFKIKVKVSENVIHSKATAIDAVCRYKTGAIIKEKTELLSLKLYSPDEFKQIDNPYAPIADGGPVPIDSKMFFGREEFIGSIVNAIIQSPSKQVIIYGQKRCGKSSVMLHLKQQLLATGKTFCIFFSLGDIIQSLTEASFYHKILRSIKDELDNMEFDGEVVPEFNLPKLSEFIAEDEFNPLNTFTNYMMKFKRACKSTEGWQEKNLVVMIDEFTYLYTEIKNGHISPSIMKQWKAVTQNDRAQFSVVLVGQDVVPSFKKEDYARNAFGVIEDIRLTYLQEVPARELIEKPILDENGNSRYIGNAVARIIEYTSRNPYYIQIFCSRLVNYMNSNKSITVTEADVNEVAKSFVVGDQALEEDKFDNLIRAGETEDLQEYPESEIIRVLREIAIGSKNIGYCSRNGIDALDDKQREDDILKHLVDREVLEKKGEDNYNNSSVIL